MTSSPLGRLSPSAGTRAEQLAALIEQRIRDEQLAPGDPIGTIEQLRTGSGLARATVGEAIRLLRDRGVLVIKPGRGGGLFVADQGPVVRMRRTLLSVPEAPEAVADAIELRGHLEELIAVGAARCRTGDDIAALRTRLAAMADAPDWEGFVRANWALHERIAEICPNAMARAVYLGTLGHLAPSAPQAAGASPEYRRARWQVHADLVAAIEAGDPDAVRAAVARHHSTE